jgi:hypothetical protein
MTMGSAGLDARTLEIRPGQNMIGAISNVSMTVLSLTSSHKDVDRSRYCHRRSLR